MLVTCFPSGCVVLVRDTNLSVFLSPVWQVYVVDVKWSDGSEITVYRRYSTLFDFHVCGNRNNKEETEKRIPKTEKPLSWVAGEAAGRVSRRGRQHRG